MKCCGKSRSWETISAPPGEWGRKYFSASLVNRHGCPAGSAGAGAGTAQFLDRAVRCTQSAPLLACPVGTLVDMDHFLAVGSRSIRPATHLAQQPPTHSLTFALLVSGGGYLFSGSLTTAWVVFAALTHTCSATHQ